MPKSKKHILIIGVGVFSHLTPLLELAKKLAKHHHITFVVSESVIPQMKAAEMIPTEPPVTIVGLVDGYVRNSTDPPMIRLGKLLASAESGPLGLFKHIPFAKCNFTPSTDSPITLPVDVVIADDMTAPALFYLHEIGVPFYSFNCGGAGRMLHYLSITLDSTTVPDEEPEKMPFLVVPPIGQHAPPVTETWKRCLSAMHLFAPLAKGIVSNTVDELEPDLVEASKKHPDLKGIGLFNVGPLASEDKGKGAHGELHKKVQNWLDGQTVRSVIYAAFGSRNILNPRHLPEIAQGLLETGQPFIFALPETQFVYLPDKIRDKTIAPFSTGEGNFLVIPWAPQKLILNHPATAMFLSHCGWNSTIEALAGGVPVVAWPLMHDMMMNALDLVKKGVAVLIEGTKRTGGREVSADELKKVLISVGDFREGLGGKNSFQLAADTWKKPLELASGHEGSSNRALLRLIDEIVSL